MNNDLTNCDCNCSDRAWFPLNSKVQVNTNNSIIVIPPIGWQYVGVKNTGGKLLRVTSGGTTVSCTCNTKGSCSPFVISGSGGSSAGCTGTCTNCTMKQSAKIDGQNIDFDSGGYIDLSNIQADFIPPGIQLPAAFGAMFIVPEVQKSLIEFINRTYGGLPYPQITIGDDFVSTPYGYSYAAVNLMGRATMVPVPTIALRYNGGGGSKASCSCTNGTCTLKTYSVPLLGSATYCEGSCSGTCTLSNASIVGNGVTNENYTAISYKF